MSKEDSSIKVDKTQPEGLALIGVFPIPAAHWKTGSRSIVLLPVHTARSCSRVTGCSPSTSTPAPPPTQPAASQLLACPALDSFPTEPPPPSSPGSLFSCPGNCCDAHCTDEKTEGLRGRPLVFVAILFEMEIKPGRCLPSTSQLSLPSPLWAECKLYPFP